MHDALAEILDDCSFDDAVDAVPRTFAVASVNARPKGVDDTVPNGVETIPCEGNEMMRHEERGEA